ncbi:ribbon-helix-helix protein, CopG family [Campylobacter coli]|uniref:ribbon-helix-helix protein, CopG family n=1 Tax=Campylobacterales TaxID=213849 RepID=UPI001066CE90|nr:ribbon-helix-helix protein, CopG family [Helicobacter pullorum]ECQ5494647.1 ribbon-helix-helix protein, CopG family [Campylobacter coli]EDO9587767.1 ribbon-helix-helix protein, CopG family [Campylobacter coli]KAB0573984.1 ribbon-helix-helix protein, CopG family [Helicobacter pullorum NCTC 12824]
MEAVKITFNADSDFRQMLDEIKRDYGMKSVSEIIRKAVREYKYKLELENWHNAIKIVDNDPKLSSILYEDLETGELLVN